MSGKRYPEEFKIEAVKQVGDRGHSVSSVATRLDITIHCLYAWIKKYGPDSSTHNEQSDCKHPGKPDHSHLEIFRHTEYIPGGDRHVQSPIHRILDHRCSEVCRSRTYR